MSDRNIFSKFITGLILKFFSVEESKSRSIGIPQRVLIVRQHNQFGDLLASVSLFRAVKETFPNCYLTVIVSPDNYFAITKNEFIDNYFIFNKKKLFIPTYLISLIRLLRKGYDLVVVPATVSISSTSVYLARAAKTEKRIGPNSLNGSPNRVAGLLNRRVDLDWGKYPDSHISDFGLEILRPFGINTKNFRSSISFDEQDNKLVEKFLGSIDYEKGRHLLIGMHVGAGKPPNRWGLAKFIKLVNKISENYTIKVYFTGSSSDSNEINYMKENIEIDAGYFMNRKIPELAALISVSDLFITNDTGVMHVAGATDAPQISIFGPTNPFNWAPIGTGKYFLRKSDLIDDVTVDDVFNIAKMILDRETREEK